MKTNPNPLFLLDGTMPHQAKKLFGNAIHSNELRLKSLIETIEFVSRNNMVLFTKNKHYKQLFIDGHSFSLVLITEGNVSNKKLFISLKLNSYNIIRRIGKNGITQINPMMELKFTHKNGLIII